MFGNKKRVRKYKKKPQPRREKRERFSEEDLELFEAEWAEDEAYFEEDEYEEIDDWSEEDETFEAEEYDEEDDWSEEDETFEAEEYDEEEDWSEEDETFEAEEYDEEEDETFEAEEYDEEDDWSEDDETFEAEEYYEDEEGYLAENDAYRYDDDDYDFEEDEVYVSYAGNRTRNRDDVGRKRNIPPKHNRKVGGRKKGSGGVAAIAAFFTNMKGMDWAIAFSGIIILILAIVTGTLYFDFHARAQQVAAFAEVGSQMDDIEIVGESGLLAIGNAKQEQLASVMEEEIVEEEPVVEEVPEEEEDDTVQVVLKVTSIQSDLKIKFVNKSSGKLIGGAPFVAKVVGDNGKEYEWDDKDQDGIIYHTDVPNGTYKITVKELSGDWAERFTLPKEAISQKVTDQIAYKKVDVKEEIKDESQVNAAVEDTAKQDTAIESTLKDTVEWVESTKTSTGKEDAYEEVKEEDIKLPTQAKAVSSFRTMMIAPKARPLGTGIWRDPTNPESADPDSSNPGSTNPGNTDPVEPEQKPVDISLDLSSLSMKEGEDKTLTATVENAADTSVTWTSDNASVATVENGTVHAVDAGTTVIKAQSIADTSKTASCTVTVTSNEENITITLDATSLSMKEGEEKTITATVTGTSDTSVTWSSSDSAVATIDSSGKIKALKKGEATITATSKASSGKTATCKVSVAAKDELKITLDATTLAMKVGEEKTLKESVTGTSDTSVEWKSSDSAIVSVDKGKVKALKKGEATITVTLKVDTTKTATCKVTVSDKDYSNDTTKLTDKSGNQLYKKNSDGSFSEATYADFYGDYKKNGGKFYRKSSKDSGYTYTGWQTIDGSTYFFDKDGNKVTGEQVIQGAKYNFDSEGRLSAGSGTMGIDVSKWNGNIDWAAVRNSGVSYVIIRCGYRGSTGGSLIEDPTYRKNIKGAKAAGLQVGVYFFTQAINEVEAVEEASMVLNLISGQGVTLPVYLDVEASGGRADGIGKDMRTRVCKAFCQTIQNSGYKAGVYANKTWFTSYINTASLTNYKIWLAQYAATPTYTATRYDMWQYSSKGSVAGISGNVDMNIRYN
ncbi:MAG: GH25 family lysozyme [Lachnospiraceae bacterium]|nr:GH25 family lysozyme [Lachnospiraceae bacterium]